jgi:4-amino-4-deoxy-L-arabinose transferase-like glycosyltransferase
LIPIHARPWLILAVVALVPRLALAFYLGVAGEPEPWEYDVIAASIHAGEGHNYQRKMYHYAAYAPPVWSYLLALLLALPGETRGSIQVIQGLFCLGAAATCVALIRRLGGSALAAWMGGLLVALQPSLLYYSVVKSDGLPLNAFLLGLIALTGAILLDRPHGLGSFGFGLLVALATLSRGTPAIAVPIVALLLAVRFKRRALLPVALMISGLTCGLAPWLIRNAIAVGEPLITSTSSENFWRGNNELATGGVTDRAGWPLSRLSPDIEPYSPFSPAIREVLAGGSEADRHRVFLAEAWRFIATHPDRALSLFIKKLTIFWWKIESTDYSSAMADLYEWIYRSELLLAIGGLIVLLRLSPNAAGPARAVLGLILALMVGISVLQSAFYVQGRHRFLIEPLLLIFTACGAAALIERVPMKRRPPRSIS